MFSRMGAAGFGLGSTALGSVGLAEEPAARDGSRVTAAVDTPGSATSGTERLSEATNRKVTVFPVMVSNTAWRVATLRAVSR